MRVGSGVLGEHRSGTPGTGNAMYVAPMERPAWPILRRHDAWITINAAMATKGGLFLAGPTGVGKTTLVDKLAGELLEQGYHVVRLVGSASLRDIPLSAFAYLCPEGAGGVPEMLGRIWRTLESEAEGRRLALIVDDAHHLDEASAGLLYQVAAYGSWLVVAAIRSGEPASDAVQGMWRDHHLERVELNPLSREETQTLLALALDARIDGATVHQLWRVTGGNLLYLRELVRSGIDSGALRRHGQIWSWRGSLAMNARLTELVSNRLANVVGAERDGLELVALAEPVAHELVVAICGADVVESLERRGLVQLQSDSTPFQLTVGHPLFGEVLRAGLAPTTAMRFKGQLADILQARRSGPRSDLLRLARWRLEAGGPSDPALMAEAARWLAPVDPSAAERLARQAQRDGAGIDGEILLGRLAAAAGRNEEADRLLKDAITRNDHERRAVALARAEIQLCDLGSPEQAAAVIREALAFTATDDTAFTATDDTAFTTTDDTVAELKALARRLAALDPSPAQLSEDDASDSTDPSPSAWAWSTTASLEALFHRGEVTAAARLARQTRGELARQDGNCPLSGPQARAAMTLAEAWDSGITGALQEASAHYERVITTGAREEQGLAALIRGELQLLAGTAEEAVWTLREASITLARARAYQGRCLDGLASALALCGEVELARTQLVERANLTTLPVDSGGHQRAWAIVEVAGGNRGTAVARLRNAADVALRHGAQCEVVLIGHDLARLGELRTARHLIADHGHRVTGVVANVLCRHVEALVGSRPHPLVMVAGELAEVGLLRFAAEAELAAAERFAGEGHRAAAAAASRRAASLIASCGPLYLAMEPPFGGPLTLTRREREISELASSGLRDQEIAEQLTLSVRTVQTHLHHAYCKLGVHSREALGLALDRGANPPRR